MAAYDYSQKQSLKSGLFILSGIIVIIFSILILSDNTSLFGNHIDLNAEFTDVQGLSVGSVVSLSGINIGNVKELDFSSKNESIIIKMKIDKQYINKLTKNSLASIKTQGALGDKYIYILPGEASSNILKDGEFIATNNEGDIFDVISKEGPKLTNIVDVISELKLLLSNLNLNQNSAKLMVSLLKTSEQSQQLLKEGKGLLSDLRGKDQQELQQAIQRLNNILGKIDRGEGSLGSLINDPVVHDRLTSLLGKPPRNSYLKPLIRATIKSND
ncbi:MAG: MCE family protein [Bdellovibrionaceae bacterium]|nr:MCE family protein [Pseudobdellovibrionaceae bacterium]